MSPHQRVSRRSKSAVQGAFLGFLLDNFDIYLPLVPLAPALIYFTPATLNAETVGLITSWIFVSTLIGRPLGALIFGSLADVIGRRRSTLIAVAGFGVATLAMAALPGYQQWGIGSVVALIVLRFFGGIALGGEYSGANVLAMEESPRNRRGLFGGLVQSGGTVAYVLLTALTLLLLAVIPGGSANSPYVQWGWRIPFVLGGLLAFAFLFYYARNVKESSVWEKAAVVKISAFTLLRGAALRGFLQVFVMMTGMWLLLNSVTALIPPVLTKRLLLSSSSATFIVMVLFAVLTVVYIGGGALSQRIGRRTYLIGAAILALVLGIPCYWFLINMTTPTVWQALIPAVVAGAFLVAPWAVVTSYLAERFKTANRAVGFGLGYSLAVVIPSFYATYQLWFRSIVPAQYTVLVLVGIGGLLTIIGAALGPETRGVDFQASIQEQVPADDLRPAPAAAPRLAKRRSITHVAKG